MCNNGPMGPGNSAVHVRRFVPDDAAALTDLLHRAYSELAAMGLNFTASYQDEAETLARIGQGPCWISENDCKLVASITFALPTPPHLRRICQTAHQEDIAWLNQMAVDPDYRGRGLARQLRDVGFDWAKQQGAAQVGLDTASSATHLLALYHGWGFHDVETIHWSTHNYDSIVMTKSLTR